MKLNIMTPNSMLLYSGSVPALLPLILADNRPHGEFLAKSPGPLFWEKETLEASKL